MSHRVGLAGPGQLVKVHAGGLSPLPLALTKCSEQTASIQSAELVSMRRWGQALRAEGEGKTTRSHG